MPKDEIQCDRCQEVLHYTEYSKSQRKQEDPMCMRCVAWGETQHHGVTPAPLATGHVSIEETTGEVWAGRSYLTDEDYCRPQAPISGRDALGLEGEVSVTNEALQAMTNRTAGLTMSETQSVASGSTSRATTATIPPHLRNRPTPSASSEGRVSSAGASALPPHLAKQGAGRSNSSASVSTATTVRQGRDQAKEDRAVDFNAWDPEGNLMRRRHVPSTVASSETSSQTVLACFGTNRSPQQVPAGFGSIRSSQQVPTGFGTNRSSQQVPAGSGTIRSSHNSAFPKAPDRERPARQVDMNVVPPAGSKVGKKSFPKPKPVDGDSHLEEWPEPTW